MELLSTLFKIEKIQDKEREFQRLFMMFLVLAIILPAYILYFDSPYAVAAGINLGYGKVIALHICSIILVIFIIGNLLKSKDAMNISLLKPVLPVMFFLAVIWISTIMSPYRLQAVWGQDDFKEGAITLTCYCIIFFASYILIRTDAKFIKLITVIWISAVILYAISMFKYFFTGIPSAYINCGGTFLHRNYMASFYTLVFLPAVAGYFFASKRKSSIAFYLISCIFFSVFILNHTRSSWVGNAVGLVLFLFMARKTINLKKLALLLISFILIVALVNCLDNGLIFSRFNTMVNDVKVLSDKDSDKTNVGTTRFGIWQLGLEQVPKYFWFGIGPDMFGKAFPQTKFNKNIGRQEGYVANAHDEYLNIIINLGIFGLLAYLWLIISIFKRYLSYYKKYGFNSYYSYIFLGVFCGWCAYLVQAFFNNSVVTTSPTYWAIIGMMTACSNFELKQEKLVEKIDN